MAFIKPFEAPQRSGTVTVKKKKTEISKKGHFDRIAKLKLYRKRLHSTETVKYLGVKIDEDFNWKHDTNGVTVKLNKVNALFFKMRKYVSAIYLGIFHAYLA